MSLVEKAYEEFKKSKEQTKTIDGKIYYRIVWSDYLEITGRERGILSIVPSPDMPKHVGSVYIDENGNHFTFGGFHFLRFTGDIPEWYFKCGECNLEWKETKNIGKYLRMDDK